MSSDFMVGHAITEVLDRIVRMHRDVPLAEYKPKGIWTTSRSKKRCRTHMVASAVIGWSVGGRAQIGVQTRCGYIIYDGATSMEPITEDCCDACLLDGSQDFAVYRYVDADGRVLYIGYTSTLLARMNAHRLGAEWWSQVRGCSIEMFGDELSARRAEVAAIQAEQPAYNVRGVMPPAA
jgi:predicted GIY-YIG superfamily endonuclease